MRTSTGSAACSSQAPAQIGKIRCGTALSVFHRPMAAWVDRKGNMSCLYSTACVYALTALNLAVYAIPLLIVAYLFIKRVIDAPRAAIRAWVPLLFLLGVILLLHGVSELIGPDGWVGLIYILAGVR